MIDNKIVNQTNERKHQTQVSLLLEFFSVAYPSRDSKFIYSKCNRISCAILVTTLTHLTLNDVVVCDFKRNYIYYLVRYTRLPSSCGKRRDRIHYPLYTPMQHLTTLGLSQQEVALTKYLKGRDIRR